MGSMKRYWTIFKLFFMYVKFKIRQYRLKTSEKIVANTTYGPIRGVKRISCWDDPFFSFEKIPFAKPPLGELRFKAPIPPEPWTEIKDCTAEGPLPLQTNLLSRKIEGCEDCLYLNVYTKNLYPSKPLPVMVWIYGGGFESGGTTKDMYSPDYFMQRDIVLITITYRVGPFGFLSLDNPSLNIPGNAGLKDQILALKWVKNNCKTFGGDENNITVFGESAGGASTHFMMLTDQTEGLFHKGILMSGSALVPWATVPRNDWAFRLAKGAGYDGDHDDVKIFEFLKDAKGQKLLKSVEQILSKDERKNRILFPFGPVIEPYVSEGCVVPCAPREMMKKAWSNNIPMIIGGTSFEGLFSFPETKKHPHILNNLKDCEYLVPYELNLDRESELCREYGLRIKKAYFGDKEPSEETPFEYLEVLSYKYFWHGLQRTVHSRMEYATAPTYLYRFDFDSPFFNHIRVVWCGRKVRGTCHGDDLSYIFLNAIAQSLKPDTKEYLTVQRMLDLWTEYARSGKPHTKDIKPSEWVPVQKGMKPLKCLNIADDLEMIDLPESKKLEVWDSMYPKELLY